MLDGVRIFLPSPSPYLQKKGGVCHGNDLLHTNRDRKLQNYSYGELRIGSKDVAADKSLSVDVLCFASASVCARACCQQFGMKLCWNYFLSSCFLLHVNAQSWTECQSLRQQRTVCLYNCTCTSWPWHAKYSRHPGVASPPACTCTPTVLSITRVHSDWRRKLMSVIFLKLTWDGREGRMREDRQYIESDRSISY